MNALDERYETVWQERIIRELGRSILPWDNFEVLQQVEYK